MVLFSINIKTTCPNASSFSLVSCMFRNAGEKKFKLWSDDSWKVFNLLNWKIRNHNLQKSCPPPPSPSIWSAWCGSTACKIQNLISRDLAILTSAHIELCMLLHRSISLFWEGRDGGVGGWGGGERDGDWLEEILIWVEGVGGGGRGGELVGITSYEYIPVLPCK